MGEIVKNRTVRPSSRNEKSISYKVNTEKVTKSDTLVVNIDHASDSFRKTYKFNGSDITEKNSISFRVRHYGNSIDISWSGAQPISSVQKKSTKKEVKTIKTNSSKKSNKPNKSNSSYTKTSFAPISDDNTKILILGTMPGDKSIETGEYYAHPRNNFWKIISTITKNKIPNTYPDKIDLLLKNNIAIWDVAHKTNRKGSLDSAIENVIQNDLDNFIAYHKSLIVIAFNGQKAKKLFDNYFTRESRIKYISLPSSSPANTRLSFEEMCGMWEEIITVGLIGRSGRLNRSK